MRPLHLAGRFFRALWPAAPGTDDELWVGSVLTSDELLLFRRLPNHDRRHAIRVARSVAAQLPAEPDPRWLRAALLHDVGKYDAGLTVPGRALATVAAEMAGPDRTRRWTSAPGWRGRVSSYAHHGEIGERELLAVGSDAEVAAWAGAHHHPERWPALGIPDAVVVVLDAADYE